MKSTSQTFDGPTIRVCMSCKLPENSCDNVKAFKSSIWNSVKKAANLHAGCQSGQFRIVTSEIMGKEEKFTNTDAYHSQCLRRFSAVKRAAPEESKQQNVASSSREHTSEKGMLADDCIFCGKCRKTWNKSEEKIAQCLTEDGCKSILEAAEQKDDKSLMSLLSEGDFITRKTKYHKSCRRTYVKLSETHMRKPTTSRTVHGGTFKIIRSFVRQEVIDKNIILTTSFSELYTAEFL